jgi:hypothetical protein
VGASNSHTHKDLRGLLQGELYLLHEDVWGSGGPLLLIIIYFYLCRFTYEFSVNEYLGTTVTNQNLIQEEIKRRLPLGSAC